MKYVSTRGNAAPVSGAEAIIAGIAPDGGLYLPESWPQFALVEQEGLCHQNYARLAKEILVRFFPEWPDEALEQAVAAAYDPKRWSSPEIVPLRSLDTGLHVMELWHGPTSAFKDLALQLLPHLLVNSLRVVGDKRDVVILVATSGDTGKAALEGFRDVPGTRIMVFYPENGVSAIQRLQMVTQEGNNTRVVAVQGNFDDAQTGVKKIFTDPAWLRLLEEHNLTFSSANSINWGRLVPQIVYNFSAYFALVRSGKLAMGEKVNFVVPTGNFGNILAAYLARGMGLPVHRLICASNRNKVLTDLFRTGVYDRRREFYTTNSPSMDILISSNLERLLFLLSGKNPEMVRGWMADLQEKGYYTLDATTRERLTEVFWGGWADEESTLAAIRQAYQEFGYVMDTHTAVGLKVYRDYLRESGDKHHTILAATANPFKFNRAVATAVLPSEKLQTQDEFLLLRELAAATGLSVPEGLRGLDSRPVRHNTVVAPDRMGAAVADWLGLK